MMMVTVVAMRSRIIMRPNTTPTTAPLLRPPDPLDSRNCSSSSVGIVCETMERVPLTPLALMMELGEVIVLKLDVACILGNTVDKEGNVTDEVVRSCISLSDEDVGGMDRVPLTPLALIMEPGDVIITIWKLDVACILGNAVDEEGSVAGEVAT